MMERKEMGRLPDEFSTAFSKKKQPSATELPSRRRQSEMPGDNLSEKKKKKEEKRRRERQKRPGGELASFFLPEMRCFFLYKKVPKEGCTQGGPEGPIHRSPEKKGGEALNGIHRGGGEKAFQKKCRPSTCCTLFKDHGKREEEKARFREGTWQKGRSTELLLVTCRSSEQDDNNAEWNMCGRKGKGYGS